MFNSLRFRLIASYVFVVLVCLLFIGLSLLFFLRNGVVIERLDNLRLNEIARVSLRDLPPPTDSSLESLQRYAVALSNASGARILFADASGQVKVDSAVLAGQVQPGDISKIERLPSNPPAPDNARTTVRDSARRVWVLVARPARPLGWYAVFAKQRTTPFEYLREYVLTPLTQAAAVGIALSVVMALLIAQWVTRPLQRVSQAAGAIAQGDFDHTVPVTGPTEVRSLARSFNNMITRVKTSQLTLRDFVANVSHELKTPLTSIQGFSTAILDGTASDPDAIRRAASVINEEAERMRRLVEGLLDLARLDVGQAALHRLPTDLAAVLRSIADKFSLRAAEKQITLRAEIDALPTVIADADRLAQVFTNLLDNAIRHTPAGGRVTVAARANTGSGGVVVTVTDSGGGIPADDLPRIFERFYRVDKSRAAGKGYGLGLAISKEIIQAHKGTITAESVQGLGTKFTVQLPAADSGDTTVARRKK
jgi:signal transduction histidine kinase